MANSILKLTVESSEYDAKLKKAAEGIQHLAEVAHRGGGELSGLEKSELQFIRALGEMETSSRTAAGKVRELTSAYTDLKVVYNQLTDAEKADESGKALAASLDTLEKRVKEAKEQLAAVNGELGVTSEVSSKADMGLKELANAFGVNISKLTVMGAAVAAAKGAIEVFTDAMKINQQTIDDWGREIGAANAVYDGFLISLNNGDISGFLSRINEIVNAAHDAYNAMSELNEFNAFNRINVQNARTGLSNAITDYRGGNATKEQVQQANEILKNELRERGKREQAVYDETINKVAKEYHTTAKDLKNLLSGNYVDWQNAKHSYIQGSGTAFNFTPMASPYVWTGQVAQLNSKSVPATSQEYLSQLARTIPIERLDQLQQLGQQAAATETEVANLDRSLSRLLNKREPATKSGGKGTTINTTAIKDEFSDMEELVGLIPEAEQKVRDLQQQIRESWDEGEIAKLTKDLKVAEDEVKRLKDIGKEQVIDLEKMFPNRSVPGSPSQSYSQQMTQSIRLDMANAIQDADAHTLKTMMETVIKNGLEGIEIPADMLGQQIFGDGIDIPDDYWSSLQDQINEKLRELNIEPIKIDFKTGNVKNQSKEMVKDWREAAGAIQAVGGAMSAIEDPAAKVVGTVAQAIATMALSYSQAALATAPSGWGWIAFAATGLATMLSSIEAIKSATHFANGGIVGGNDYTDNTLVKVSSGELILNKSQQANLASQLTGGGLGNLHLETYLDGRAIRIVLNNDSQSRMKGRYVTSKNYRG